MLPQLRLEVLQQPARARMCGISDKDRRLICPPPCVHLAMAHPDGSSLTPKELEAMDVSQLILITELYDLQMEACMSIVQSTYQQPAVPVDNTEVLMPRVLRRGRTNDHPALETNADTYTLDSHGICGRIPRPESHRHLVEPRVGSIRCITPPPMLPHTGETTISMAIHLPLDRLEEEPIDLGGLPRSDTEVFDTATASFHFQLEPDSSLKPVRNIIGNLVSNAFKLTNDQGVMGVWFVIPDLSIRIEGQFRLKFSLLDLGGIMREPEAVTPSSSNPFATPTAAEAFSDAFSVYSAKKFPGVLDTTRLSKAFAAQGVKIPVKKEAE